MNRWVNIVQEARELDDGLTVCAGCGGYFWLLIDDMCAVCWVHAHPGSMRPRNVKQEWRGHE